MPRIILEATMTKIDNGIRVDLATLGDATPTEWKPGGQSTGPNIFASVVKDGDFPEPLTQDFIDVIGKAMRISLDTELAVWGLRHQIA